MLADLISEMAGAADAGGSHVDPLRIGLGAGKELGELIANTAGAWLKPATGSMSRISRTRFHPSFDDLDCPEPQDQIWCSR
jgi:hypothetical protein